MSHDHTQPPPYNPPTQIIPKKSAPETLIDYFAGQALAGILAHSDGYVSEVLQAWDFAEAMMREREKRNGT